jgi:transcription-repair coupling factor (superfamily II helicase)
MNWLKTLLASSQVIDNLMADPHTPQQQLVVGINGSARAALIAARFLAQPQMQLVVTDTQVHAEQLVTDLQLLLPDITVGLFAMEESLATEMAISSPEHALMRVQAMQMLQGQAAGIVVTSVAGLGRYLPQPDTLKEATLLLEEGQIYAFDQLKQRLHLMGYRPVKLVQTPGEYAQRGSIIDVFPLTHDQPLRLDFFDEELDQIKTFDVSTQQSQTRLSSVTLLPVTDFIVSDTAYQQAQHHIEQAFEAYRHTLAGADKRKATEGFASQLQALKAQERRSDLQLFAPYFFAGQTTLLDYLPDDGLVIIDDYVRMLNTREQQVARDMEWIAAQKEQWVFIPEDMGHANVSQTLGKNRHHKLFLANFERGLGKLQWTHLQKVTTRPATQYYGQLPVLKPDLQHAQDVGQTVILLINDAQRAKQFQQSLADFGIDVEVSQQVTKHRVQIVIGDLSQGFDWTSEHLTVLTETELFAQAKKTRPRAVKMSNAERLKSYNELNVGDYVVHVNHGIGQYEGLQTIERDGGKQDYLTIGYQKNAKILIPVTQLNLIQKYVGANDAGKAPKLNKLGGTEWAKTKRQVAAKIEDIADELLTLYAQREAKQGFAFPPDDRAQTQFEVAFGYSETPDQVRSIEEIKMDMQKARPMDRLLVGDVGFGKTEVALRAVFKAAHAGKQVAFLAPTTILAQQHYETMLARFADFPDMKIGVLSRFQTAAQNKQLIEELKAGSVNIVVGTHRLLSQDVAFADLGLLIIDEEQRFGVKHKEKLKQYRTSVDVLTLTATPIPRTLNMAMVGARDLSVIETPPANRYPIQTYVMAQDWTVIRDAVEKELARHGQVFYLHNRVSDIERVASQIEDIVPQARVAVIHGQMSETKLESILYDFLNQEYDVLVTTTIIETGVDIPNANTLIVENADHMGLSQLYQLRGRVGRSTRVAYAYFTYPFTRTPSEDAEKRLEAIRDFTELGSGFKIAMRDLAIRGAGDLLGKQQHGFIDSVGYDLYTQMLKEAVAVKQGQSLPQQQQTDAELVLGVPAFLPDSYVPDNAQKIDLYTRIRQAQSVNDFEQIEADLLDRFGEMPDEAARLLVVGQIKPLADQALVTRIRRVKNQVTVSFHDTAAEKLAGENIFVALKDVPLKANIKATGQTFDVVLTIDLKRDSNFWLQALIGFLQAVLQLETA